MWSGKLIVMGTVSYGDVTARLANCLGKIPPPSEQEGRVACKGRVGVYAHTGVARELLCRAFGEALDAGVEVKQALDPQAPFLSQRVPNGAKVGGTVLELIRPASAKMLASFAATAAASTFFPSSIPPKTCVSVRGAASRFLLFFTSANTCSKSAAVWSLIPPFRITRRVTLFFLSFCTGRPPCGEMSSASC